jgi:hypothetical protein
MRVIRQGRFTAPPVSNQPWWIGRQETCAVCGAVLEVTATDTPFRDPGITPDESVRVVFSCPEPHADNQGAIVVRRYPG